MALDFRKLSASLSCCTQQLSYINTLVCGSFHRNQARINNVTEQRASGEPHLAPVQASSHSCCFSCSLFFMSCSFFFFLFSVISCCRGWDTAHLLEKDPFQLEWGENFSEENCFSHFCPLICFTRENIP